MDDTGFVQGIQKMSSKQIKLTNDIKKTKAEMDKLEKAMEQMQNTKVPTKEYAEYQKVVAQTEKQLNSLLKQEQMIKDIGGKQSGASWDKLQYKIQDARNTLQAYKNDMAYLENSGTAYSNVAPPGLEKMQMQYDRLKGKLLEYTTKLSEVQAKESKTETSGSRVSKMLSKLASACSKAWAGMKKLGSIAGSLIGSFGRLTGSVAKFSGKALASLGGVNKLFSRGSSGAKKYGRSIGSIFKSIILYQGISKMIRGVMSSMWSMLKTNDQFVKSFAQIKGNLLTAFQPIYDACLPAINALASGLAKVTGYIAQFTSMLFGKSVKATQAAASAQYNEAQALKDTSKAAKDANKQLSDIDELHNISTSSGSGSSTDSGIKPDFTTDIDTSNGVSDLVKKLKEAWNDADFTEVGTIIANKINSTLTSIDWGPIQANTQKIAQSIATFINGFANVKEMWDNLGRTIGNGINTAVGAANNFITTLDWSNLGDSIGRAIDNTIKTIDWNLLGETIFKYYNGVFAGIDATISAIDWAGAGTLVGNGLQTIVNGADFNSAGKTISNGISSIAIMFNNLYAQVDFVGLGSKIAGGINTMITVTDWARVGKSIGNGFNFAIDTLYGLIHNFDWREFGTSIATGLNNVLTTTNWAELAAGASDLVRGLAGSIISAVQGFDWTTLGSTLGDMFCTIDWGGIATDAVDLLIAGFNAIVNTIFGIGKSLAKNIMDGLSEGIKLSEILSNAGAWIKKHIFDPIVNNFKKLFGIHSPSTVFYDLGKYIMQGMINGITSLVSTVNGKFKSLLNSIKGYFTNIPDWFGSKFGSALTKIKSAFSAQAVKNHFNSIWEDIKSCFSNVASWFKTTFTVAWTNVKNVFSTGGKIFDGIKDGIGDTFKTVVNKLIDGINAVISTPFNAINSSLNKIRSISILGVTPFEKLWSQNPISVPRIPKLATGTVVPKNYGEFMAILGDNKRETEVVSPISTIEKAVENVLDRKGGSSNGEISFHLTIIRDGKKEYDNIMKINKEQAASGKLSFALN